MKKEFTSQYTDFVFKLRNKYGDVRLSEMSNFEIDMFCKLLVQMKYNIPISVIENYANKKGE
jgi:phospholipid N-methyltransferase